MVSDVVLQNCHSLASSSGHGGAFDDDGGDVSDVVDNFPDVDRIPPLV